jgi:membrane-associated protein
MAVPDILSLSTLLGDIQGSIPALMEIYGVWVYLILFAVIFCETGLVFAPFLPGDSLLFLMGFLAAGGGLNLFILIAVLTAAAVLGDSVNYRVGTYFGSRLLSSKKCLIDRRHVETTRQYYRKYGKNTIILARFVPGVRSLAPFVAGIVRMDYPVFLSYNIIGGFLWVSGFVLFGYIVASLPLFKERQEFFLWAILCISFGILFLMLYNIRKNLKECAISGEELSPLSDMDL